ncbi:hypothetical protein COM02_20085 [Bacillus toyonensis]|nr:hypothetical protein COM02_20085 [Bacillus toyonensis]
MTKRKTFHHSYEMFFSIYEKPYFLFPEKNGTISGRMEFYIKRDWTRSGVEVYTYAKSKDKRFN